MHDPDRPLVIGGVEIPHELAFEGHSDADVLLHALADALLGAIGAGDIGIHFPDTDPTLKGIDSKEIVSFALSLVRDRGYAVSNCDITFTAEVPRLAPHRQQILESVARLLELPIDRVGLKGTTTEKMGAIGRKEGASCQVTLLLYRADG